MCWGCASEVCWGAGVCAGEVCWCGGGVLVRCAGVLGVC